MKTSARSATYCFTVILFFFCFLYFLSTSQSIAESSIASSNLDILKERIDLLQKINERLLQTVYWTLATFAAIFLGIVSVNLYFNISANKREILTIKDEIESLASNLIKAAEADIADKNIVVIQREIDRVKEEVSNITTSDIKTSEVNMLDKINALTQREIDKASTNLLNIAKNEVLVQKAESLKLIEETSKKIVMISNSIEKIEKNISEFDIRLKEMEVYKYSQEGKLGAIIVQIELLEHDLENKDWNLKYRLPEILTLTKRAAMFPDHAQKLRELLGKIKNEEYLPIVKEILASITVRERSE